MLCALSYANYEYESTTLNRFGYFLVPHTNTFGMGKDYGLSLTASHHMYSFSEATVTVLVYYQENVSLYQFFKHHHHHYHHHKQQQLKNQSTPPSDVLVSGTTVGKINNITLPTPNKDQCHYYTKLQQDQHKVGTKMVLRPKTTKSNHNKAVQGISNTTNNIFCNNRPNTI